MVVTAIEPGPVRPPDLQTQSTGSQVRPGQTFAGAAQAASGTVPGGRTWQQICNEAREKRNIMEIQINLKKTEDNTQPKAISNDQLSDFIFKVLKVKVDDAIGLDYSGWHGHKEVELKHGVDLTPFLHTETPIKYLEYEIFVKKQETHSATKVLFRNVPLNVPDEELINLCLCYGQPTSKVKRERCTNQNDIGKLGSNRTVDVVLNAGASFENYFWMEGPLPFDQGRRVTVTLQGQQQQCSNCFSYSKPKYGISEDYSCPANGNGKACKEMGLERTKMGPYMKALERLIGYRSLKAKYSTAGSQEEVYEDEEDTEVSFKTVYKNPIIERDEKIQALEKEHQVLKEQLPAMQEELLKTRKEMEAMLKAQNIKSNIFRQAAQVTEHKVAETIRTDPGFLTNNPHLIPLLSLFQDRDEFSIDAENDMVTPIREEEFLKGIAMNIEASAQQKETLPSETELYKERLGEIRNLVLENVKKRWIRPGRRDSIASHSSSKRGRDMEVFSRTIKPRAVSPEALDPK